MAVKLEMASISCGVICIFPRFNSRVNDSWQTRSIARLLRSDPDANNGTREFFCFASSCSGTEQNKILIEKLNEYDTHFL